MSSKVEVLWSPNKEDEFAAYGTDLKIYTFSKTEGQLPANALPVSASHHGVLTATLNSGVHCMPVYQCVAWQHSSSRPYFFAVGQSSGKVLLTNVGLDRPGSDQSNRSILGPRTGRPCTCLAWNPSETHLLAEGLEKSRNDNSLIVWDVNRASPAGDSQLSTSITPSRLLKSSLQHLTASTPDLVEDGAKYFDFGAGEATTSLSWLPSQPSCIVAGMGNRFIRMFDIREHSTGAQVQPRELAQHKALLGISVDPSDGNRLASYADGGTVYLWDIRHFARPVYSFSRSGTIQRLSWAPTRGGCLSVVLSEPPYLRLIDLPSYSSPTLDEQTAELYTDHLTQLMADRCPYYCSDKTDYGRLSGVTWHPSWDGMGLLATTEGVVKEVIAYDKMPISWSSRVDLMYGSSSKVFHTETDPAVDAQYNNDISVQMKERLNKGYGFIPESNIYVVEDDPVLKGVWEWVKMQKTMERSSKSLLGIASVLGATQPTDFDGLAPAITSKLIAWRDREGAVHGETPQFPIYDSKERKIALLLCGWSFEKAGASLEDYLKRQEMEENFERAAAIAVFHGHIRRGITSLKDGATIAKQQGNTNRGNLLNLIALALSGYTTQESRLWRETCVGVKTQINNPYLRATFNFLCSTGRDGFIDVLKETQMSLPDQVAFACTYLDDRQLCTYISELTQQVKNQGNISGLFLTGLPEDGLILLSNYVNMTGDVQLACLLSGQVMMSVNRSPQVQAWFQGYRDLLDRWQMWHQRALFDGERKKLDPTYKPARQAFVVCNFCSKSIASDSLRSDRRSAYHAAATGRKATSCPNCRKPLPRCSLCLLNMVATGNKATPQAKGTSSSEQTGQWFTWCQSCRHGGHANHIAEWFSNHQECPVTGCSCTCYSLDPSI